jgi:cell division protein FtsB
MPALLRQLALVSAVLIGGYYAYTLLTGPRGFAAIYASHAEVQEMEKENERLRQEIQRHEKLIRDLKSNPDLRDRMIRQRLEKQKPGETVILDGGEPHKSPAAPIR